MRLSSISRIILSKFMKIEKNLFVFTSFSGHYSDNPKYISEELHKQKKDARIVWLVSEDKMKILPDYIEGVLINSSEATKLILSAEVIVDNVYANSAYTSSNKGILEKIKKSILKFLYTRKGQHIFTTWHGTPLKCMGRDQVGNTVNDFVCGNINMLLGNKFTAEKMKHLTFGKIPIEVIGTPRNDILFCDENKRKIINENLGLPKDKKVVLFAPTFRNDGKDVEGKNAERSGLNQINELDFEKLFEILSKRFGGEWLIVCRFHYHVEKLINWNQLNEKYNGRIVNGNINDDMAEYLACADVLITDASSSMFDFSLTQRPCFLYFPDIDYYEKKERGFYLSPSTLPFKISKTAESLYKSIECFDEEEYKTAVKKMQDKLGFVDDANSSKRIVECILKNAKNE